MNVYGELYGQLKNEHAIVGNLSSDEELDGLLTIATGSGGSSPSLQRKSKVYTPAETTQTETIHADAGYDGLIDVDVSVEAISSTYVGSGITRRSSTDLTASGATITVPSGYYSSQSSKSVSNGSAGTPTAIKGSVSNHAVSVTPSVTNVTGYITGGTKTGTAVSVSASELVSGTKSISANGTGIDVTNYSKVNVSVPTDVPALQEKSKTYTPTTSQQTDTITADSGYGGLSEVDITIGAMPSGTAGTPTATKGTVSNSSVSITPSVTNTTGYIIGSTKTGTAVTVSASELVSGTKTITENDTGIDVTNFASVDVAVPSSSPTLQTKSVNYTPATTDINDYVHPSSGYDGLSEVQVRIGAMPSGTAGTPTATKGTVSNNSVDVTPSVTNSAGYITGGTKSGTAVTVTASELVSGNKAITENGTDIDVVNYATVSVAVSGDPTIVTGTYTPSTGTSTSMTISNVPREPKAFAVCLDDALATISSAYYYIVSIIFDGTSTRGEYWRANTGALAVGKSQYSFTYNSSTQKLSVTSSGSRTTAGGSYANAQYRYIVAC